MLGTIERTTKLLTLEVGTRVGPLVCVCIYSYIIWHGDRHGATIEKQRAASLLVAAAAAACGPPFARSLWKNRTTAASTL
jgi:hypothetical protein